MNPSIEWFVDIQRAGRRVWVIAKLGIPEPEVGLHRLTILSIRATADDGKPVALTTEEVHGLANRFESQYHR